MAPTAAPRMKPLSVSWPIKAPVTAPSNVPTEKKIKKETTLSMNQSKRNILSTPTVTKLGYKDGKNKFWNVHRRGREADLERRRRSRSPRELCQEQLRRGNDMRLWSVQRSFRERDTAREGRAQIGIYKKPFSCRTLKTKPFEYNRAVELIQ